MASNVSQIGPSIAKANGIDIAYDTFGDADGIPLLLIAGIGLSMAAWDERFYTQIADKGYRVIRFDNRDMGRSTRLDTAGVPDVMALMRGEPVEVPYLLRDMADDTVGLLDALGIDSAHILGVSMGASIGQEIAIHYPQRVRTLTVIMSTTGDPSLPQAKPEAAAAIMSPPQRDRSAYIEQAIGVWGVLNGSAIPLDEAYLSKAAGEVFDYGLNPAGSVRQLAAIRASGSREAALTSVEVPALVIHGDADPLVPVEHGIATANALPNAELIRIKEMGHLLAPSFWPRVIETVSQHAQ